MATPAPDTTMPRVADVPDVSAVADVPCVSGVKRKAEERDAEEASSGSVEQAFYHAINHYDWRDLARHTLLQDKAYVPLLDVPTKYNLLPLCSVTLYDDASVKDSRAALLTLLAAGAKTEDLDFRGDFCKRRSLRGLLAAENRVFARNVVAAACDARNKAGATAMHVAAAGGSAALVKFLAESGVPVNVCDAHGVTPLMVAATSPTSNVATVRTLLACGALIVFSGASTTPLHLLLHGGDAEERMKVLLAAAPAAALCVRNKDDFTPLAAAAARGDDDAVCALVAHGADKNDRDAVHLAAAKCGADAMFALAHDDYDDEREFETLTHALRTDNSAAVDGMARRWPQMITKRALLAADAAGAVQCFTTLFSKLTGAASSKMMHEVAAEVSAKCWLLQQTAKDADEAARVAKAKATACSAIVTYMDAHLK